MKSYAVLLRGINVGGKNKIPMAKLKLFFEELGFKNVTTYIQSGNVVFKSNQTKTQIRKIIEEMLPVKFKLDSTLIVALVLSYDDLKSVIDQAPKGFGAEPAKHHSDVIFLIDIISKEAMSVFSPKEGVDRIWPGTGVIYSQRLSSERAKSRLNKIVGKPAYKNMTIRNWNTVTNLLKLLEETLA